MKPKPIILSEEEIAFLTNIVKTSPKELHVKRARMILLRHKGMSYPEIASVVSRNWTAVSEALAVWRNEGITMFTKKPHSTRKRLQDVPEGDIEKLQEIANTSLITFHRLHAKAILLYKDYTPIPKILKLTRIESEGKFLSLLTRFRNKGLGIFESKREQNNERVTDIRKKIVHHISVEDFRRCSTIYYDSTNNALRRRAYVIVLRYKLYSHAEIAKKVFSDEPWVEQILQHYEKHGLESMLQSKHL